MGIKNKLIKIQMKFATALIATVAAVDFEYITRMSSLLNSPPTSPPPRDPRPEVMPTPPLPRPPPSRTSRRPSPLESSRDSMMDSHSLSRQKDEGHRGHAATDQRYGEKTRYHAVCRASPRERHQDPPEGRRCQRNGQEMSTTSHLTRKQLNQRHKELV